MPSRVGASPASIRPTSRPQAYPAAKLAALNNTTKPADIIHVIRVGDTVVSSMVELLADDRDFLTALERRSFDVSRTFLFVLCVAGSDDEAGGEFGTTGDVDEVDAVARGLRAGSAGGCVGGEDPPPISRDSGMSRSEAGSIT